MTDQIVTDGCTGFPDSFLGRDLSQCCAVHDTGGSDGGLLDCLDGQFANDYWLGLVIVLCVFIMRIFRPVYNLLQRFGILPKTAGSKF